MRKVTIKDLTNDELYALQQSFWSYNDALIAKKVLTPFERFRTYILDGTYREIIKTIRRMEDAGKKYANLKLDTVQIEALDIIFDYDVNLSLRQAQFKIQSKSIPQQTLINL